MTREELNIEYIKRLSLYDRALKNVIQALEIFLQENKIMYLNISGRVKDFESFAEKTERKHYTNPFEDNEDFCGVRIIGYYLKDLQIIEEIIVREFNVISSIDKTAQLSTDQFGYRSNHFIIKIKEEWLIAPNYRGLNEIKLEIQVRTILMHAWAEIEHKLAYKNKESVPKEFQRQLSWLSAKFEESDGQFQKLKDDIEAYRDGIKLSVESHGSIPKKSKLNYDSLSALLDYYLTGYPRNKSSAINLLERLRREQLSIAQIEELLKKIQPHTEHLNEEVFPNKKLHLTQATVLSYADDIFNAYDSASMYSEKRKKIVERFKAIVSEEQR
jgi:putative GTP pyrophosphokinase